MTGPVLDRRALLMVGLGGLVGTAACTARAPSPGPTPPSTPTVGLPPVDPSAPAASAGSSATGMPTATPSPAQSPSITRPSLAGDTRSSWAFAPLSSPTAAVVEGSVGSQRAWSTSKVLVVAALIATAAGGDPSRLTSEQQRLVTLALTASDAAAIRTLKAGIRGDPGSAMDSVLRSIGDSTTKALGSYEGTMTWTVREQVRFMAAMSVGRVVSPAASAYILSQLHPIPSQQWGLATVGATAVKGGWLRANTETRQMGILNGYAVAIISGVGPAVLQSDGDSAHVAQMNLLARQLLQRLA